MMISMIQYDYELWIIMIIKLLSYCAEVIVVLIDDSSSS